ncbi:G-alpha-domain-containing protein [Pleurotus eryngii]|uniref:G-alpha-domain-containing protein n=1 Tax=Pleurotus eryngii TaxID=5323 RepID=A0A9P5ZZU4_PLEER|nr:G-alpha-domain-containing protein [Pleurotus eryngii]
MTAITRRDADIDPLTVAMAPPPNESEEDRQARLAAEHAAKVRSDAIDEELNRQRQAEKRALKQVKVLLLGQSESGKSTTLKNFQLMHSPKAFRAERALWKAVIQLNIVRSIRLILDSMTEAQEAHSSPSPSTYSTSSSSRPTSPLVEKEYPRLSPDLLKLKMRLSPLLSVEEALTRTLAPSGSSELEATRLIPLRYASRSNTPPKEPSVYAGALWKGALGRLMNSDRGGDADDREEVVWDDPKDPGLVLHACAADMTQLWNDTTVRKLLEVQRLRLEEMAGFFLDSLDRVTAPKYVPSDGDILRARLKTLGVSEHRFKLKTGNMMSHEWTVFDVGGQRSLRAAWVPYFDDVEAIIFLAPISCFDQVLQEDPSVNRLEDSILLWKAIISNPLLKHTSMILFLNKCDIMKAKLASGIQFSKYVISYGDRPNNFEAASNYLRKKFSGIHKQCSPKSRSYYCHFTSVIDTSSTLHILQNVQDVLLRSNLEQSSLV